MKPYLIIAFSLTCSQGVLCTKANEIVREARRHICSLIWSYDSDYGTGSRTNKCNQFVHDVLDAVGADPPMRLSFTERRWAPIGAGEWGNPYSIYIMMSRCWDHCSGPRQPGDVISDGTHVAIVTGSGLTTSASHADVVENDWGYRSYGLGSYDSIAACWRHNC